MSWSPTADEIADRYAEARLRVMTLTAGLDADQTNLGVPGTPKWTVRELLSHVVGCPIQLAAGQFEGAGSDHWTQAQVKARVEVTVDELMAEWDAAAGDIDRAIRSGVVPAPVTFDVITHEQDLRGAIGAAPLADPDAVRFVTGGFAARLERVAAADGLPPVELRDPESGWSAGVTGGVIGRAAEFEWFRALTGRRSRRQVAGFDWSADPAGYFDVLCPFGPLRETDVSD